jgi:hypothetical protein
MANESCSFQLINISMYMLHEVTSYATEDSLDIIIRNKQQLDKDTRRKKSEYIDHKWFFEKLVLEKLKRMWFYVPEKVIRCI